MIDAKALSQKAAELYHALDSYDTWDKRDIVSILNTIMNLELERKQRASQKPVK